MIHERGSGVAALNPETGVFKVSRVMPAAAADLQD
jgi:hypothetical protein